MKFLPIFILSLVFSSTMHAVESSRPRIYQLFVRTFGNTNETRKPNGTLAENGCGKFNDINDAALTSLCEMGFTHVWLTGVLEQASGTAYDSRPADDADILKGIAGSPYAIKDYFDVCPDYASKPEKRMEEFKALLARCQAFGLKTIIDFVPNHVARSYQSDVKPELSFGVGDDQHSFFARENNFFYLRTSDAGNGPPLRLPTEGKEGCNGRFSGEETFGRVTGNNVISWAPSINDWYETVKLNYGHDYTTGRDTSHLPAADAALTDVPKTWRMMDAILQYWQGMGVGGFRVDMAHMVPMEFWAWSIKQARARNKDVFFMAEAYDNDPAKLCEAHVLDELLARGFDAVYDDPTYDVLMGLYDEGKWSNDLDPLTFTGARFHQSLRYGENHDEVRLATSKEWGNVGMQVGKPVCATLFAMGRGPVMVYNGQEVGEPAEGSEGFGGDDGRTTIFDYWSMPAFTKWVNGGKYDGGKLSEPQKNLYSWYGKLLKVIAQPAFEKGEFYGLNHANKDNSDYGRLEGESASGHWLYAFLRSDPTLGQSFLVVVNFNATQALENVRIVIPEDALGWLKAKDQLHFSDRLDSNWTGSSVQSELMQKGLLISRLEPCSSLMLEISSE
jgi:glycosidase